MSRALRHVPRFHSVSQSPSSATSSSCTRRPLHNGPAPRSSSSPRSKGGAQPGSTSGPPGETPKEKVARLRAEWRAKHIPPLPLWDRIVLRGRSMANTAHTVVNVSILGFTVLLAAGSVYVLSDMFRYNRRKKREFFETQRVLYATALEESRQAVARGDARPEHLDMLENERLAVLEEERQRNKSHVRDIVNYLFQRQPEGATAEVPNEVEAARRRFPLPPPVEQQAAAAKVLQARDARQAEEKAAGAGSVVAAVEEERRKGERAAEAQGARGGPLDQIAAGTRSSTEKSEGDQRSWFRRMWS